MSEAVVTGSTNALRPRFLCSLDRIVFALFAFVTAVMHWRAPVAPGQDYNYHLFATSVIADEHSARGALYRHVTLSDPNTLVYHVAAPFVRWFGVWHGLALAMIVLSYLGFPLACYYALRRQKQPVWGAVLAFPLLYTTSWVTWGYLPFVSSTGLMILAISEFDTAFTYQFVVTSKRRALALVLCSLCCVLCFTAHAQAYAWLATLLGALTLRAMKDAWSTMWQKPSSSFKDAGLTTLFTGLQAALMIAPSMLLILRWNAQSHSTSTMAGIWKTFNIVRDFKYRTDYLATSFKLLNGSREQLCQRLFWIMVATAVLASLWRRTKITSFEVAFLYAVGCFMILPPYVNGQSIAERYLDFAYWILPLVIYSRHWITQERQWYRRAFNFCAIASLLCFSVVRHGTLLFALDHHSRLTTSAMLSLVEQTKSLSKTSTDGRALRLGSHITQTASVDFVAASYQQVQSNYAALTGLDTPCFNTTISPGNMLPLRHRVNPTPFVPAYLPRLTPGWYKSDAVWQQFDWILTFGILPNAEAAERAQFAEMIAQEGDLAIYRRRRR